MKLTLDNFESILKKYNKNVSDCEMGLMRALLTDCNEYNTSRIFPHEVEIHIITEHTKYSPEWTEPLPDYYGTYYIKYADVDDYIIDGLDIDGLDNAMFVLCGAFEQLKKTVN